jgi:hypothetical protein
MKRADVVGMTNFENNKPQSISSEIFIFILSEFYSVSVKMLKYFCG